MWHDSPCDIDYVSFIFKKANILRMKYIFVIDDNKYICEIFEGVLEKWKIKLLNIYLFYYPKKNCVYLL